MHVERSLVLGSVPQKAGAGLFNVVQMASSVVSVHTVHLGVVQVANVVVEQREVLALLIVVHLHQKH